MDVLARAGGAMKSIWSQGSSAAGAAKVVGRSAGMVGGAIPGAQQVAKTVGGRMARRGMIGAAIGAGGSMLRDKAQGNDVSLGRAAVGGALGGAIGAASGTTMGKRMTRRLTNTVSTPNMSLGQAANPMRWGKGVPGKPISLPAGNGHLGMSVLPGKARSAFGNMSVLDKAMTVQTGYEGVKALTSKEYEGHRAEGVGSALGQGAALMTGARWGGMRKGRSSALGHLGRTTGLYLGAGMGGSMIGRQVDKGLSRHQPQMEGGYV